MASFRKRGGTWRVELCVLGQRRSATFTTKREAQQWAAEEEARIRSQGPGKIPDRPFSDLMDRYSREVSATKRGGAREQKMINVILRDKIADVRLPNLTPTQFAEWRNRRLEQVSAATVDREMTILSHACTIARREWGWLKNNPMSDVQRPTVGPGRSRRPTQEETDALLFALGYKYDMPPKTISSRVGAAYLFAMETAMRAGEIAALHRDDVHDTHVHIPTSKNGFPRDVPLTKEARRIIDQLLEVTTDTVFEVSAASIDALFRKAKKRAMIEDLHFHDTRREALTRLSKIFGVMELARISGHRDLRVLQNVYYAPTVDDLAKKLK